MVPEWFLQCNRRLPDYLILEWKDIPSLGTVIWVSPREIGQSFSNFLMAKNVSTRPGEKFDCSHI
ncbi:hypothetical protein Scep_004983 [Stephania cephalantha]|uniref:Uncharacterized protein n=1 Tax=Stephania cephalantha TaxID=152367 RepID=A0AAP0PXS6_9MAGN